MTATLLGTPISTTVGSGSSFTLPGTFSASDTIDITVSGTVDNFAAGGPDGYTTNAAGIVTIPTAFGNPVGSAAALGSGAFSSGALLISNDNDSSSFIQQLFPSITNGLGSSSPPTNLSRRVKLGSIFGPTFTSTASLTFAIEPYFSGGGNAATASGFISKVPTLASTGGYTLAGSISSPSATEVPEPFTIVGTLIGGTAALRMRKKLKADNN